MLPELTLTLIYPWMSPLAAHPRVYRDADGCSALHLASQWGHPELVRLLCGHPEADLNGVDRDGHSALHLAVECGHADVVKVRGHVGTVCVCL